MIGCCSNLSTIAASIKSIEREIFVHIYPVKYHMRCWQSSDSLRTPYVSGPDGARARGGEDSIGSPPTRFPGIHVEMHRSATPPRGLAAALCCAAALSSLCSAAEEPGEPRVWRTQAGEEVRGSA
jgi:hypothetical protein